MSLRKRKKDFSLRRLVLTKNLDTDKLNGKLLIPVSKGSGSSTDSDEKYGKWVGSLDKVRFGKVIGEGSGGKVFEGQFLGTPCAIKQVKTTSADEIEQLKQEVSMLKRTRHPNVVIFFGYCDEPLSLVMELCDRTLWRFIHIERHPINSSTKIELGLQICQGLEYLHGYCNILHRDLKSPNILLTNKLVAKISDFGMSTSRKRLGGTAIYGTHQWIAPEVCRAAANIDLVENPYSEYSDLYSYGIILFELCTGQLPYSAELGELEVIYQVAKNTLRPKMDLLDGEPLKDLITKCLERINVCGRPSAEMVIQELQMAKHKIDESRRWYNVTLDPSCGISFIGCQFDWKDGDHANTLHNLIWGKQQLLYLELAGNVFGVDAFKVIGNALESKSEFVAALWKGIFKNMSTMSRCNTLDMLLDSIDSANARLQCLDLSDNALGPVGMASITQFFKSTSSFSLKELIFNNNECGPTGGSILAKSLLRCYKRSSNKEGATFQIKVFRFGNNGMEDKAARDLADFFRKVKSLEEIHIPRNRIGTEGINALTDAFCHNMNLKVLNISHNAIGPEGCIKLSECLTHLVHLKELNVDDCLILTEGVNQLSGPLSECSNLEKIMLGSNKIDDEGVMEIANILAKLPKLNEVNLCGNEFTSHAVEDIQRILSRTVTNVQID